MKIHLITVVGGNTDMLPFMLNHYRTAGVQLCALNVHLRHADDPVRESVSSFADRFDCTTDSTAVGDWQAVMHALWQRSMALRRHDWCVLADQDEFHAYPADLPELLLYCERKGYDYLTGAFVDRVSADGDFPTVDYERPVHEQFPLGGFLTFPILGGNPQKVVVARGSVLVGPGQHRAFSGRGCPMRELLIPVHHFKWTAGVMNRLTVRADELHRQRRPHWIESDRFVRYCHTHQGRIDVSDKRFMLSPCCPDYPEPSRIIETVVAYERRRDACIHGASRARR